MAAGLVLAAAAFTAIPATPAPAPPSPRAAAARGVNFLRRTQQADGAWRDYPGITAVCLLSLIRSGVKPEDPVVQRGARYLAGLARPDGAIYSEKFGPAQALPNYNTALAISALQAVDRKKYASIVRAGRNFLVRSQYDEGEGVTRSNSKYGGIGYGSREDNPDLSNLQNALEALRDAGHPRNDAVFRKAILFIQRCQNRESSNDQPWAGTDGGFIYSAQGESKADEKTGGRQTSYGSMTYAGLKSYLYCGVTRADPRAQAAWRWIRGHWDVNSNPLMGDDGLYYHYQTMAKTLAVWGEPVVTDLAGRRHRWKSELGAAVAGRQQADGSWKNRNPRWWEDRAELATGFALLALASCTETSSR